VGARGFSLIETLVALVVMSVGLLGVAALHVDSMQRGQEGLFLTRAVLLAADMGDRIRANPLGSVDYAIEWQVQPVPGDVCADTSDGPAPGWPAGCDPTQMAKYDVQQWKEALAPTNALGLPAGTWIDWRYRAAATELTVRPRRGTQGGCHGRADQLPRQRPVHQPDRASGCGTASRR